MGFGDLIGYNGLRDENGDPFGVKHVNNKIRTSSMPYTYDIAEGNVEGHQAWTKIGYTPTMTSTESDIWSKAGVYTWPSGAGTWEVLSSDNTQDIGTALFKSTATAGSPTTLVDTTQDFTSVAVGDVVLLSLGTGNDEYGWVTAVDTAASGVTVGGGFSSGGDAAGRDYLILDYSDKSGAHAVKISYLNRAFEEKTEIVVLNGSTPVPTTNTDLYRVNAFRVIVAGSDHKPKGNITLRESPSGTTFSYISLGYTRARNNCYTVPVGKTLYVTHISAAFATTGNANKEYARLYTRATQNDGFVTPGIFYPYTEVVTQNGTIVVELTIPTKILSGVDIKMSGVSSASGIVSTVLRGWLETS